MSKMGDHALQWLNRGGYNLGYSLYDLPELDDMEGVIRNDVRVWEYRGVTEKEYYGG